MYRRKTFLSTLEENISNLGASRMVNGFYYVSFMPYSIQGNYCLSLFHREGNGGVREFKFLAQFCTAY